MKPGVIIFLAIVFIAVFCCLAGAGPGTASPLVLFAPFGIPVFMVFLAGLLCGSALMVGIGRFSVTGGQWSALFRTTVMPFALLVTALLFVTGVSTCQLSAGPAAAAFVLLALALLAGGHCFYMMANGAQIGFESHWGGLGGGSGGWRIFPATALATLSLAFAGGALTLVMIKPDQTCAKLQSGTGKDSLTESKNTKSQSSPTASTPPPASLPHTLKPAGDAASQRPDAASTGGG
jgi:hypothetical protein